MRIVIKISFHIAVAISVTICFPNNAIAANGTGAFGGLSVTPTAQIDSAAMTSQFQNRVIGTGRYDGINLTNVFGLSEFLEVGGRIAANTTTVNLYTGDGGIRDLSASVKVQLNP